MSRAVLALALIAPLAAAAAPKGPAAAVYAVPAPDLDAALREDAERAADPTKPFRYGVEQAVDLGFDTVGRWSLEPDGARVWRAEVRSPGALHLGLLFDVFEVPPGATLTLTGRQHELVMSSRHNRPDHRVGASPVKGDRVVMTYREPAGAPFQGRLHVDSIVHAYRDLFARVGEREWGDSGWCNVNAACPEADDYRDQVESAVVTVAQGWACSGTLINNTSGDLAPLVLTANHCLSRDVSRWVFWFNYESRSCAEPNVEPEPDVISGATLLANRQASDFALLRAAEPVPTDIGAYFAGWDHTGVAPTSAAAIHFPAEDIKKFSREFDPLVTDPSDPEMWQVRDWDVGTTEGGSSGSGLYDQNGRIVGQLFGGQAACGNNASDYYGKLSRSWDTGSTASTRLRDWLDPAGISTGVLDGTPAARFEVDAAVLLESPVDGGTTCGGAASARVTNVGQDEITSLVLEVTLDGARDEVDWSGSLGSGESTSVVLQVDVEGLGAHELSVEVLEVNGRADENPANDASSADFTAIEADGSTDPLAESFDGGLGAATIVQAPTDGATWQAVTADSYGDGGGAVAVDNLDQDTSGTTDALSFGPFDLGAFNGPTLSFDVAYATYGSGYEDGLRVWAVDACGGGRTLLYERFGEALATAPSTEDVFVPTSDQWRTEVIDLSVLGAAIASIEIENVGGYGQWLYVDDVALSDAGDAPRPDDEVSGCTCSSGATAGGWLGGLLALGALVRRRRG